MYMHNIHTTCGCTNGSQPGGRRAVRGSNGAEDRDTPSARRRERAPPPMVAVPRTYSLTDTHIKRRRSRPRPSPPSRTLARLIHGPDFFFFSFLFFFCSSSSPVLSPHPPLSPPRVPVRTQYAVCTQSITTPQHRR
ncbi:hypothetical protein LX36DRAFT_376545 [Colletotrichum falcatum]|nr:hypothetical protein LX36DRAFT_376545 [Colletotrichum falcatum]